MPSPRMPPPPGARKRSRHESSPLALVCAVSIACLGFAGFIVLAAAVMAGHAFAFDRTLLLALRTQGSSAEPVGPAWLAPAFASITSLGSAPVLALVTLAAVGRLLLRPDAITAALLAIATIGGARLCTVLKAVVARPRPDLVSHLAGVHSLSFPSDHAMAAAITYLMLGALLAGEQAETRQRVYVMGVAIVVTLLVGCSRVYLGVHWPTDVLAGWCIGSAWAMAWWGLARLAAKARRELSATTG